MKFFQVRIRRSAPDYIDRWSKTLTTKRALQSGIDPDRSSIDRTHYDDTPAHRQIQRAIGARYGSARLPARFLPGKALAKAFNKPRALRKFLRWPIHSPADCRQEQSPSAHGVAHEHLWTTRPAPLPSAQS